MQEQLPRMPLRAVVTKGPATRVAPRLRGGHSARERMPLAQAMKGERSRRRRDKEPGMPLSASAVEQLGICIYAN
jgi:hypothetical protein